MTRCSLPSDNPLISVVIPTLNTRKAYLDEALACVQGQSLQPWEVVIVNNGHGDVDLPDTTLPVRVINTVYRAGAAQARNLGVSLAKTVYVAFLDDDDLWATDYLEGMVRRIKVEEPDCLIARLDQLVDGRILPFKNAHGLLKKDVILLRNPGITGSPVVVKKDAFLKAGGYNPKLPPSEDKALILEFLRQELHVVTVPECQAILRQHGKGGRLTESRNMAEGIYQFYRLYKEEMNLYQKAFNLFKIHKHRWESERSLVSFVVYVVLFFICLPKRIIFKFLSLIIKTQ
jgi:glycosyltransferase involved in cell wall biosynthesis